MVRHEITHVVFDVGGILIRHARSWREAHLRTDVPWDAHFESPIFEETSTRAMLDLMSGKISPDEWCEVCAVASEGRVSAPFARRILKSWQYEEYPGVGEVIEELHARGIATAALSNTNAIHWEQMLALSPALRLLQQAYPSHQLGAIKPDGAVFEAFERASGFPRSGVLFFDDSAVNVEGARRFGWRAELIDHTGDPAAQIVEALRRYAVFD